MDYCESKVQTKYSHVQHPKENEILQGGSGIDRNFNILWAHRGQTRLIIVTLNEM